MTTEQVRLPSTSVRDALVWLQEQMTELRDMATRLQQDNAQSLGTVAGLNERVDDSLGGVAVPAGDRMARLISPCENIADQRRSLPQIVKDNMARMTQNKLEKCYGINVVAKNDCAEGAHSCAGQATQARDTKSFVLLPAGDCGKIQGGKTTAT